MTENTKVIDVSYCQENAKMDSAALKRLGVRGCIIRTGYLGKKDTSFDKNLKFATDSGFKVGFYLYNIAKTIEDTEKEALESINIIKKSGVSPDLPLYFDFEDSRVLNGNKNLNNAKFLKFCEVCENNKIKPGLYVSPSILESQFDYSAIKSYPLWIAHYTNTPEDVPSSIEKYSPDIWQWGYIDKDSTGEYVYKNYKQAVTSSTIDINFVLNDNFISTSLLDVIDVKKAVLSENNDKKYDVNGDSKVDLLDAVDIKKEFLGIKN